jgi:hypothetical protein
LANKIKIRIPLSDTFSGETLWAEQTGENLFRLLNIPFFAFGYAEGDIVRCMQSQGWNQVTDLEKDSGNGTLRLVFGQVESNDAQFILSELASVGCTYEIASSQLVAVTIPPNLQIPFSQLSNFLNGIGNEVLNGWEIGKKFTREA